MANVNELLNAWGYKKQAAIGTANVVGGMWRHTNLNTKPWAKVPVNEDDRMEIGKGHEFPTQLFKSHYNMLGDGIFPWQRDSERLGTVRLCHHPSSRSHEPDRPRTAVLFVRAADPAWRLGGARRNAGGLRGQGLEAVDQKLSRPCQRDLRGGVRDDGPVHFPQRDHGARHLDAA
jgi:hypothetical protein